MNKQRPCVVLSANAAWNIANFRLGVAGALIDAGYQVIALAPPDGHVTRIEAAGVSFVPIAINRKGMNPMEDLALYREYARQLASIRPVAYLGWTIKPNIFGSAACRRLGIPAIPNIAGLGFAFGKENLLTLVVRVLYKFALARAHRVFFQNDEDLEHMVGSGIVKREVCARLPGSGVDVERFSPRPAPALDGRPFRVLMCARLLKEKGFADLADAVKLLKAGGHSIDVRLLGPFDDDNPSALRPEQIEAWVNDGLFSYLGEAQDIRPHLADVDAVVLPSYYREGLPRALLEAASMAKPVITTDSVGCRDSVVNDVTGLLCRARDPAHLADRLLTLMSMTADERLAMGARARARIVQHFDERLVAAAYLAVVRQVSGVASPADLAAP
jgi:glycosyltransferase involved in cell wall biosynthesis